MWEKKFSLNLPNFIDLFFLLIWFSKQSKLGMRNWRAPLLRTDARCQQPTLQGGGRAVRGCSSRAPLFTPPLAFSSASVLLLSDEPDRFSSSWTCFLTHRLPVCTSLEQRLLLRREKKIELNLKMTAKHRKGKANPKPEENFLKTELLETEVRPAGNSSTPLLVLVLVVVIGGATGAWICFQQHQTLTYLTDNLMGIQMKIAKLQSSYEELRLSNTQVRTGKKTDPLPFLMISLTNDLSRNSHSTHKLTSWHLRCAGLD